MLQSVSNGGFMVGLAAGGGLQSADGVANWLLWLSNWVWFPSLVLLAAFLPLLFPDGRLPSPRWRWFAGS